MSEDCNTDPRQFVLAHHWPNTPGIYGCTLQAIYSRHGAAPLIAMSRWSKIDLAWPGTRYWLTAFLSLPEIKPAADAAVAGMVKTKSLRKKKQSSAISTTAAQRARNEQMGFF